MVPAQGDHTPCQTPTRQKEPHCGCVITQPCGPSHRVDSSSGGCQSGVLPLGDAHDGFVCNIRKPQTPHFCVTRTRSMGHGCGCPINIIERGDRLCVPSHTAHSPRVEQNSEGKRGTDYDSAARAVQTLVSSPVGSDSRAPSRVTEPSGSPVSGSRPGSSRAKSVPPSRVQVVEQALTKKGFSRSAAAVIARPQRAGTLATYEHKWQKFSDWCNERKINPLIANASQIADFLLFLFREKKFASRSIAVYRTAISSTIKNLGGEDFGYNGSLSAMMATKHMHASFSLTFLRHLTPYNRTCLPRNSCHVSICILN